MSPIGYGRTIIFYWGCLTFTKIARPVKSLSATEIGFNLESHYNNQSEHQEAMANTEEELEKILSDELVASC